MSEGVHDSTIDVAGYFHAVIPLILSNRASSFRAHLTVDRAVIIPFLGQNGLNIAYYIISGV